MLNRVRQDSIVRGLRSAPVRAEQTSTGRLAPSRALGKRDTSHDVSLFFESCRTRTCFFAPLRSLPNSVHRTLASSLRSGPRRTDVHWTSCFSVPLRSLPNSVHRTLASSLRSGPRRTDVHWTSCAVSRSPSKTGYLRFSLRSSPRRADKFYLPLSNGKMIFR